MLNFSERLLGLCPYMLWLQPNGNGEHRIQKFSVFQTKRARPRSNFVTQYQMRYAIHIPLNSKDLRIDPKMHAYKKTAERAKVGMSKQLWFVASAKTINRHQALCSLSCFCPMQFLMPSYVLSWIFMSSQAVWSLVSIMLQTLGNYPSCLVMMEDNS